MHLYLVRHGFPTNSTDIDAPLSPRGIEQATMLGQLLADQSPQRFATQIIASHLKRAYQTAEHMCNRMGIPEDQILEWPTENDWKPASDFQTRFIDLLRKITEEGEPSEVVVVGHFNYLNDTLAWEMGQEAVRFPDIYGATALLTCTPDFGKGTGELGWLVVPYPVMTS